MFAAPKIPQLISTNLSLFDRSVPVAFTRHNVEINLIIVLVY